MSQYMSCFSFTYIHYLVVLHPENVKSIWNTFQCIVFKSIWIPHEYFCLNIFQCIWPHAVGCPHTYIYMGHSISDNTLSAIFHHTVLEQFLWVKCLDTAVCKNNYWQLQRISNNLSLRNWDNLLNESNANVAYKIFVNTLMQVYDKINLSKNLFNTVVPRNQPRVNTGLQNVCKEEQNLNK